jgi:hypothetical protein
MANIEDAYLNHFDDRWAWRTVCWLHLTDKGKELALELYHADEPGVVISAAVPITAPPAA